MTSPGKIDVPKVLKGLQIFSVLLLLKKVDSILTVHLSATKSVDGFSFRADTNLLSCDTQRPSHLPILRCGICDMTVSSVRTAHCCCCFFTS